MDESSNIFRAAPWSSMTTFPKSLDQAGMTVVTMAVELSL